MTVQCEQCGARLKVKAESLGNRKSAKCPRCQGQVTLRPAGGTGPEEKKIVVACSSCHAQLKAPASRLGTSSRCPRCRATVTIVAAGQMVAQGSQDQEESTGAATRRIDSRSLGVDLAAMARSSESGGTDLDEFMKSEAPREEEPARTGLAESLVKPDTGPMRDAAEGIRRAAEEIAPAAKPHSSPAPKRESTQAPGQETAPEKAPSSRAPHAGVARPRPGMAAFPSSRGFLAGGVAGALVGGLWAVLADRLPDMGLDWLVAPVALPGLPVSIPDVVLRLIILTLLGAATGFVAAAIGSPRVSDRPLSLLRCGGMGIVAGLAFGLLQSLAGGSDLESFAIWPSVDWMRDVLLAGLFTPAVNKLIPGPRS